MANRTLALVSTMLNYALVELEWIEANPAARIARAPRSTWFKILLTSSHGGRANTRYRVIKETVTTR
jgi:hypothetical protein